MKSRDVSLIEKRKIIVTVIKTQAPMRQRES